MNLEIFFWASDICLLLFINYLLLLTNLQIENLIMPANNRLAFYDRSFRPCLCNVFTIEALIQSAAPYDITGRSETELINRIIEIRDRKRIMRTFVVKSQQLRITTEVTHFLKRIYEGAFCIFVEID